MAAPTHLTFGIWGSTDRVAHPALPGKAKDATAVWTRQGFDSMSVARPALPSRFFLSTLRHQRPIPRLQTGSLLWASSHVGRCGTSAMRERITYVQKLGDSLEPSALTVDGATISGPEVHAVREDRLTFALHELPPGLQTLLRGIQDVHIRWVSTVPYDVVSPLLARLPPGFHLFFTPGPDKTVAYALCSPETYRIRADIYIQRTAVPHTGRALWRPLVFQSCCEPATQQRSTTVVKLTRSLGIFYAIAEKPLLTLHRISVFRAAR
jgi:hypothetical protein